VVLFGVPVSLDRPNRISRNQQPPLWLGVTTMEILIYVANGLYLLSYMVKDILKLRLLTVAAACVLVIYFAAQPQPVLTIICWNLFFVGLNILQIATILHSRIRPAQ
jgi:hypothetical protein